MAEYQPRFILCLEKIYKRILGKNAKNKGFVEAYCALNDPITGFELLDFMLQARKAVVEEYPLLNWPFDDLKKGISGIRNGIVDGGQGVGSFIYEMDIPGVSDFVGEFTKVREEGAESNIFSVVGSFANGVIVKGAGQTVEGINKILANPEETIPVICSGVADYVDKKIIHGTPEDRAEAAGQGIFEIASFVVGVGEAKAAARVAKTIDKMEDVGSASKYVKIGNKVRSLKESLKMLGKNLAKGFDDFVIKAYEGKTKLVNKATNNIVENIRATKNAIYNASSNKLERELVPVGGPLDYLKKAPDESVTKNPLQQNFNEVYGNRNKNLDNALVGKAGGSGVNIKKETPEEIVEKLGDDVKNLDATKGTSNHSSAIRRKLDEALDSEFITKVKETRKNIPKRIRGKYNFGYAEVDIVGLEKKEFYAHSTVKDLDSIESVPRREKLKNISVEPKEEDKIFKTLKVNEKNVVDGNGAWDRARDTEFKILNEIASKIDNNASGKIKLYTDLNCCPSCQNVIE
ncbi:MAG: hypothetical protein N4A62_03085 [Marinisporobacter sp.]|nr:hypothetical protein [Marinisporobacter sp.]